MRAARGRGVPAVTRKAVSAAMPDRVRGPTPDSRRARVPPAGRVVVLAVVTALLAAACGRAEPAPDGQPRGALTVGSGAQPGSRIIASMYAQALRKAGYEVTPGRDAGDRAGYLRALQRGEIDVMPDYLSALTDHLDVAQNGPVTAARLPKTSGDVEHTQRNLVALLAGRPLQVGPPSPATNQTAYAVTKELADRESLRTMSDLVKLNGQLVLGGPAGCPADHFCLSGLQDVYRLRFKDFKPIGPVSSKPVFTALADGTVDVGPVLSADGAVAAGSLVVLKDDKRLQHAQNILALYRDTVPAEARAVVEQVNQALTTEKLQELNKKLELDGGDATNLAKRFLQDAGLV